MNWNMDLAILIKILLEITCLILCMRHVVQTIVYFSMNLEIIRSVFKPIFSQHQYLSDHLVKIYKATSNIAKLVFNFRNLIFGRALHLNHCW